jgi:hypothetical protein
MAQRGGNFFGLGIVLEYERGWGPRPSKADLA